jgi:hypothetical protein
VILVHPFHQGLQVQTNTRHDITDSTICILHPAFLRPLLSSCQFYPTTSA